jgi:hypothetical protein
MSPDLVRAVARQQAQERRIRRQLVASPEARPVGALIHLLHDRMPDEAARHAVTLKDRRLERQERQQMIDVARELERAFLAPSPCLRGPVVHACQWATREPSLQAQAELWRIDGQHHVRPATLDLMRGLAQPAPQARRTRQFLAETKPHRLLHRERAAQATARHVRAADAGELEPARRLLPERLDQTSADRVARRLTREQKNPSRHETPARATSCAARRRCGPSPDARPRGCTCHPLGRSRAGKLGLGS